MKSKEERFLELISCIDINNPVMDFDNFGNRLFWLDAEGYYICNYDSEIGWFGLNYDRIWSVFEKEYGHNYIEIHKFLKSMVEKHLKIKDAIPWGSTRSLYSISEEHFKFRVTI